MQFAAAGWRRYPRIPDVEAVAEDTRRLQQKVLRQNAERWLELQREKQRETGFPGNAAIGHRVMFELRKRKWPGRIAEYAAHLAAVNGPWNWQGNTRIGAWMGRSARQTRRYRVELEKRGLIKSHLLLTGDKLPGQRAAVRRPMVARNVEVLQQLAGKRSATTTPKKKPGAQSPPARRATPSVVEQVSPEHFEKLAEQYPEWASALGAMAAARRASAANARKGAQQPTPPKPPPNAASDEDVAEALREWEAEQAANERGPPNRQN